MNERELTPSDYLLMFRRHWILVLVLTLVGGPLAYAVSLVVPVRYKSQTLVLVEQPTVPTSTWRPSTTRAFRNDWRACSSRS